MRHKKKNTGRTVLIALLALVLLLAIAAVIVVNSIKNYDKPKDSSYTGTVDFVIPQGASTTKIGMLLENAGIIDNANVFKLKSKLNKLDGKFQAGEYELSPSMGMNEIMRIIQDGKRETVKFTVKEGLNIRQIATLLENQGLCSKLDFYKSLEEDNFDYWFVPLLEEKYGDPTGEVSAKANRFEGFLYPDTYEIYKGASARNIINKMLGQFDKVFSDDLKKKMEDKGLSIQEALSVAALIEKEIKLESERALCASVIYNRLNGNATGKLLQMDASIQYMLGNDENHRVLYKDLEIDNPYNTYKYPGLTPGPICSPGKSCIEAALNPADTNYLYYVVSTKGDGSHKFTASYSQHQQNAEAYHNSL